MLAKLIDVLIETSDPNMSTKVKNVLKQVRLLIHNVYLCSPKLPQCPNQISLTNLANSFNCMNWMFIDLAFVYKDISLHDVFSGLKQRYV